MTGPEILALADRIVYLTQNGPVVEWNERIAEIAREAELPLAQIRWNQAPKYVAYEIVDYSSRAGIVEKLRRVISKRD